MSEENHVLISNSKEYNIAVPERSEWCMWVLGDFNKEPCGQIVYHPIKGTEPNWFHRKMQELCFGFQWRKIKN